MEKNRSNIRFFCNQLEQQKDMLGEVVSYKEGRLMEMVGEFEDGLVGLWEEKENEKGKGKEKEMESKGEGKRTGINGVNNVNGTVRNYTNNNQQGINLNGLNINANNNNNLNINNFNNNLNNNNRPLNNIQSRQPQPPTSTNQQRQF